MKSRIAWVSLILGILFVSAFQAFNYSADSGFHSDMRQHHLNEEAERWTEEKEFREEVVRFMEAGERFTIENGSELEKRILSLESEIIKEKAKQKAKEEKEKVRESIKQEGY